MEELIIFILLAIGGLVLALPISAFVIARKARHQSEELDKQIGFLREQNARLKERVERLEGGHKPPRTVETPAPEVEAKFAPPVTPREFVTAKPAEHAALPVVEKPAPPPIPPPRRSSSSWARSSSRGSVVWRCSSASSSL